MRHILYRGKDYNGYWRKGFLDYRGDTFWIHVVEDTMPTWSDPCGGRYSEYFEIDYQTMGQYVGIQDKFQHEIFEGDIVKYMSLLDKEEIGYVKFKDGSFRLSKLIDCNPEYLGDIRQWNDGDHDWYSIENIESFDIQIIGNIYDNPELL